MKKTGLILLTGILILVIVVVIRTLNLKSLQNPIEIPVSDLPEIPGSIERLAQSITFKTVSYDDTSKIDYSQFLNFHEFLKTNYPLTFENLDVEVINRYTLMLLWKGKDEQLPPGIFMAHQDVVPVDDDSKDMWTVPAFDGLVRDGILYGRGVIDDKINLMGQLEAVEYLLQQGFKPQRSVYFVFGHDEEIGGREGAKKVAELLESRKVKASFVLDEGGIITYEKVPGMEQKPVALIGTSEKGFLTLELTVEIPGGHSSFPSKETSIDVMAKAITSLRSKPFPAQMSTSVQDFMNYIAPEMPFINKMALGNLWLFKPVVYKMYGKSAVGDAMIRTTMVPTVINGGVKGNVIPTVVKAKVNFRIQPGTSIEDVVDYTRKAINDERVKIEIMWPNVEASPVSSPDSTAFRTMMSPLKHHFDDAVVAPFLMIGGTDSRHFYNVTPNIYKFSPMIDPIGFHGVDEQLKISDYKKTLGFYHDFIKSL